MSKRNTSPVSRTGVSMRGTQPVQFRKVARKQAASLVDAMRPEGSVSEHVGATYKIRPGIELDPNWTNYNVKLPRDYRESHKPKVKREGRLCPACGMIRSMRGTCDCNE